MPDPRGGWVERLNALPSLHRAPAHAVTLPHLDHASDDCPGEWRLQGAPRAGTWRCDRCGREHPSTEETDLARLREYGIGAMMRNEQRKERLRTMRPPPAPPRIEIPEPDEEA